MIRTTPLERLRLWSGRGIVAAAALLAVSWWAKGRLPTPAEIRPESLPEPVQEETLREPFSFPYEGRACRVRPVASYEIAGLVVTHNDIHSFADIYHDASSVDTKDLCIVWGANLEQGDYLGVDFWSGPFTCYARWPAGSRFDLAGISNSHLIADDASVRRAIAGVRIGDQVRLRGLLVDYQMDDWEGFWRRTSTRRDDGDCEVLFVESVEVLARATPGWYRLFGLARGLLVGLPLLWVALFALQAHRGESVQLGRL
ncbi:MAG: hypothetical protein KJ058_06275 [Thermoanaerobaculia bacterium]|nr:hypothetical protein [Thermoanaerobaculia bacterium]